MRGVGEHVFRSAKTWGADISKNAEKKLITRYVAEICGMVRINMLCQKSADAAMKQSAVPHNKSKEESA